MRAGKSRHTKKALALISVLTALSLMTACAGSGNNNAESSQSSESSTVAVSSETGGQESDASKETPQESSKDNSEQSKDEPSQENPEQPSAAESSEPEPSQPESSEPEPSEPEPSEPEPSEPEPSEPEPSEPEPSEPEPSEPEPSEPEPSEPEPSEPEPSEPEPSQSGNKGYSEVIINGKTYYQIDEAVLWSGEYRQDDFYLESNDCPDIGEIVTYDEYIKLINKLNGIITSTKEGAAIDPYYNNKNKNYIILCNGSGHSWCDMYMFDVIEHTNKVIIYGYQYTRGVMASGSGYLTVIPTDLPTGTKVDFRQCHTSDEIENLKNYGVTYDPNNITVDKPIIYLYPTEETKVRVELGKPDTLTCSYPKYTDGWSVIAKPDGTLTDLNTGRELYSLYYECADDTLSKEFTEGFVVKGEDSASFLEEKLALLGFNPKEAEEFIVYWLPKLEANKYNLIRFASPEEIEKVMPLNVSPAPDSVIRVLMIFKGIDEPVGIPEQTLVSPERTGFTLVEWGASYIG